MTWETALLREAQRFAEEVATERRKPRPFDFDLRLPTIQPATLGDGDLTVKIAGLSVPAARKLGIPKTTLWYRAETAERGGAGEGCTGRSHGGWVTGRPFTTRGVGSGKCRPAPGSTALGVSACVEIPASLPLTPHGRAMTEDNADLFFRCHTAIWSVDHLRPSAALNELCKLLYAKICDERRWGGERFHTVGSDPTGTGKQIRVLYADAVKLGSELLGDAVPKGILEESLQLSDPAIFGVVALLQSYSFAGSGVDVKGAAFQQLTDSAVRSGMGQ